MPNFETDSECPNPECRKAFHSHADCRYLAPKPGGGALVDKIQPGYPIFIFEVCPSCKTQMISVGVFNRIGAFETLIEGSKKRIWPPNTGRQAKMYPNTPKEISAEYAEACAVLHISPKASAAMSRRCLQHLLVAKANVKKGTLDKQIDEVLPNLPRELSQAVDAIRTIGNFAAHPIKSTTTGAIEEVEPGEAEWSIEVLESLFDFYCEEPAKLAAKRAALNQKLTNAGKPILK